MQIGFRLPELKNIEVYQKAAQLSPDFWIERRLREEYAKFLPQTFDYLPSAHHLNIAKRLKAKKLELKNVKSEYLSLNKKRITRDSSEAIANIKYVVFNEVFNERNELRPFYNLDFFKAGLSQVKELGHQTVFNEHRLVSLFWVRQKRFVDLVKPLIKEGLIDYIGLQVWDIGRQIEMPNIWFLIKLFKAMGAKVLISEFGIYEPNPEKQAKKAANYLRFFKDSGVESVGYWWLRDGPHTAMPAARDPDKNPGLYTANWDPKPILDVFAKYVGTTN